MSNETLHPTSPRTGLILALGLVLILAFAVRTPGLTGDFNGMHDWKNIRHYQFAISMLETHNFLIGRSCFTQPETDPLWINTVLEAPWLDWSLAALFAAFKPSIILFQTYFIVIDVFTVLLFFLVMRRLARPWLALLGALLYALTPVCVYFASYSLGEAFLKWGTLLWMLAALRLFSGRSDFKTYLWYVLACVNLVMCKLTTGALMGDCAIFIGLLVWTWRFYPSLARKPPVRRFLWLGFIHFLYLILLAVTAVYLFVLDKEWIQGRFPLVHADYYKLLYERFTMFIGFSVFCGDILAVLYFLACIVRAFVRPRGSHLSNVDKVLATLLLITIVQWVIQAEAYIPHEYYMNMFVVPALALLVLFFDHLANLRSRIPFVLILVAFCGLYAWRLPAKAGTFNYLFSVGNIPQADQDALTQFFTLRKWHGKKQFIIAEQPRWAFHAGVNMKLVYSPDKLLEAIHKDDDATAQLIALNDPYVILPQGSYLVSDAQYNSLNENLLLDFGPEYYKLGVVYRGKTFFILKITDGIVTRSPLSQALLKPGEGPFWIDSEKTFKRMESSHKTGMLTFQSTGDGQGVLFTYPFSVIGDVITFHMHGSLSDSTRVELRRYGEAIYRQCPIEPTDERYAFDVGEFWNQRVDMALVDSISWKDNYLSAGDFEIVIYSDPIAAAEKAARAGAPLTAAGGKAKAQSTAKSALK